MAFVQDIKYDFRNIRDCRNVHVKFGTIFIRLLRETLKGLALSPGIQVKPSIVIPYSVNLRSKDNLNENKHKLTREIACAFPQKYGID